MAVIKKLYTAAELAACLKLGIRGIQIKATKEGWPFETKAIRGGHLYLYPFATLPIAVRSAIYARTFNVDPARIDDARLSPAEVKARLDAFDQAPAKFQAVALARRSILAAMEAYATAHRLKRDPVLSAFAKAYAAKAVPGLGPEVYGLIPGMCAETLRRWRKALATFGIWGLIPEQCGKRKGDTKIIQPIIDRWVAAIAVNPNVSGKELNRIMHQECDPEDCVHVATVHRWYADYRAENAEYLAYLRDPRDAKNKYQPAFGSLSVNVPHAGHTWMMDSTPADVRTTDKHRCAIVAALDVYSRRAVLVVVPTSRSVAIAACMRKGMLGWGLPEKLVKDNGKDYSSNHITAVCEAFQIDTPPVAPYKPEHKGNVERFFGTFARDLEANLPGFLGHCVAQQAAIRERDVWLRILRKQPNNKAVDIPLSMAELQAVADKWLEVYERRVHRGFASDPGRKLKGLTPLEAWAQSPVKPTTIMQKDERVLDILLSKGGTYTVQKSGLRFHGGRYVDACLVGVIGQRVRVLFDPENAGRVWVYQGMKFIGEARDEALTGQRLSDYLEAKARKSKDQKAAARSARELSKAMHQPYEVDLMTGKLETFETPPAETVLEFRAPANTPAMESTRAGLAEIEARAAEAEPAPPTERVVITPEPSEPEPPWLEVIRWKDPIVQHEAFKAEAATRPLTEEELTQWAHIKTYQEVKNWDAIEEANLEYDRQEKLRKKEKEEKANEE